MLVLKGNCVLDLLELGLNPRIRLVAVSMKFGKGPQALLYLAVINKPALYSVNEKSCVSEWKWY